MMLEHLLGGRKDLALVGNTMSRMVYSVWKQPPGTITTSGIGGWWNGQQVVPLEELKEPDSLQPLFKQSLFEQEMDKLKTTERLCVDDVLLCLVDAIKNHLVKGIKIGFRQHPRSMNMNLIIMQTDFENAHHSFIFSIDPIVQKSKSKLEMDVMNWDYIEQAVNDYLANYLYGTYINEVYKTT